MRNNTGVLLKSKNRGNPHIINLGLAFAGNSINSTIFRHSGLISRDNFQFSTCYFDEQTIRIFKRDLNSNIINTYDLIGNYSISDAHKVINIGIDAQGFLHIAYDAHNEEIKYRKASTILSIDNWSDEQKITSNSEKYVTYPTFFSNFFDTGQSLFFIFRDGHANRGKICMKAFSTENGEWKDVVSDLIHGSYGKPWKSSPYLNTPIIDRNGTIHISYVWRTYPIGKNKLVNNIGIDYVRSLDGGESWQTISGVPIRTPITQINSERIFSVPIGTNLINQAGMDVDSKGYPHIVYYSNDLNGIPQIKHLWFNGKNWENNILSTRSEKFTLEGFNTLQLPISRPEIIINDDDTIYVIYRENITKGVYLIIKLAPPNFKVSKKNKKVLWSDDVGFAEPVIDKYRWKKENILSMIIQKVDQPNQNDIDIKKIKSDYLLVDWNLADCWKKL